MEIFWAIVLGIVQGLTEWLPISSSGHLAIFQNLFSIEVLPEFHTALNIGTIFAAVFYLRKDIFNFIRNLIKFRKQEINYFFLILIAGIPTAFLGFTGREFFKSLFINKEFISLGLIISGVFLLSSKFLKQNKNQKSILNPISSFFIGLSQGLAIAPGISRSGLTISTGLMFNLNKEDAFKFSFFIGLPAQFVASILELNEVIVENIDLTPFFIGIVFSGIFGYLSISFLIRSLREKWFHDFFIYCFALSALIFIFL